MDNFLDKVRGSDKITSKELIPRLIDSFVSLRGDQVQGVDPALISGIGLINEIPVTVVGIQRGHNVNERISTNGGSLSPCGYKTCLRLFEDSEKYGRPILTIVDTPGAFCDLNAEVHGQAQVIASLIEKMSTISVPVISLLIGEGGSGGALALLISDFTIATRFSMFTTISPEGYSEIMWKNKSRDNIKKAVEQLKGDPLNLRDNLIIDQIIEDLSRDNLSETGRLRDEIYKRFKKLREISKVELLRSRQEKYDSVGGRFIERV